MSHLRKGMAVLAVMLAASSLLPPAASAATSSQDLTMVASILPTAVLALVPPLVTFTPLDIATPTPGDVPIVVTVEAITDPLSTVTLTALANGDLIGGPTPIPASNVSWTASGVGFVDGTMDTVTEQSVGSWLGSGLRVGTLSFTLAAGAYDAGLYTQTATFLLTAP